MHFNKNNLLRVLLFSLALSLFLTGCSTITHSKLEIPETKYTQAGYAVTGKVENDGTIKLTYALIGLKENEIVYLYLDQIENNPKEDRHTYTNKELGRAYGLIYQGDKGEWSDQIKALTTYIEGNKMTIDEVNSIPTYQKDENNPKVPTENSDLGVACELDLSDFLEVINKAYNNRIDVNLIYLGVGDDVKVSNKNGRLDVTFAFMGTDYRSKIQYSHLESYSIVSQPGSSVLSNSEKSDTDEQMKQFINNENAFEKYVVGLNMYEAYSVETYDPGDGINLALPKKNTDLAEVCNMDLSEYILVLREAGGRLS